MGGARRSVRAGRAARALAVVGTLLAAMALLGHLPGDDGGWGAEAASQTDTSPDLVVFDVRLSAKELTKGGSLGVNTLISNKGNATAENVSVTFLHGSRKFAERVIPVMAPGDNEELEASWSTDTASVGSHNIRVVVDLANTIRESNETNNEVSAKVVIKENPLTTYSIPILLLIAVLGLLGYRAYTWAVIRGLRRRQHGRGGSGGSGGRAGGGDAAARGPGPEGPGGAGKG
jgi:hypothetical protein